MAPPSGAAAVGVGTTRRTPTRSRDLEVIAFPPDRFERELTCGRLWQTGCEASNGGVPAVIPDSFSSLREYVDTFEPLVAEEARAGVRSEWAECCAKGGGWSVRVASLAAASNGSVAVSLRAADGHAAFRAAATPGSILVLSSERPPVRDSETWAATLAQRAERWAAAEARRNVAGLDADVDGAANAPWDEHGAADCSEGAPRGAARRGRRGGRGPGRKAEDGPTEFSSGADDVGRSRGIDSEVAKACQAANSTSAPAADQDAGNGPVAASASGVETGTPVAMVPGGATAPSRGAPSSRSAPQPRPAYLQPRPPGIIACIARRSGRGDVEAVAWPACAAHRHLNPLLAELEVLPPGFKGADDGRSEPFQPPVGIDVVKPEEGSSGGNFTAEGAVGGNPAAKVSSDDTHAADATANVMPVSRDAKGASSRAAEPSRHARLVLPPPCALCGAPALRVAAASSSLRWWAVPMRPPTTSQREHAALLAAARGLAAGIRGALLRPTTLADASQPYEDAEVRRASWPRAAESPQFIGYLREKYDLAQLAAIEMAACHLAGAEEDEAVGEPGTTGRSGGGNGAGAGRTAPARRARLGPGKANVRSLARRRRDGGRAASGASSDGSDNSGSWPALSSSDSRDSSTDSDDLPLGRRGASGPKHPSAPESVESSATLSSADPDADVSAPGPLSARERAVALLASRSDSRDAAAKAPPRKRSSREAALAELRRARHARVKSRAGEAPGADPDAMSTGTAVAADVAGRKATAAAGGRSDQDAPRGAPSGAASVDAPAASNGSSSVEEGTFDVAPPLSARPATPRRAPAFTLIQGPPGTGKTHTIVGVLNVWHLVAYQRYYDGLVRTLVDDSKRYLRHARPIPGGGPFPPSLGLASLSGAPPFLGDPLPLGVAPGGAGTQALPTLARKPRILVCAPSNAATDELLSRVVSRGFRDGSGGVYWPNVVRVGATGAGAAKGAAAERSLERLVAEARSTRPDDWRVRHSALGRHAARLGREASELARSVADVERRLEAEGSAHEKRGAARCERNDGKAKGEAQLATPSAAGSAEPSPQGGRTGLAGTDAGTGVGADARSPRPAEPSPLVAERESLTARLVALVTEQQRTVGELKRLEAAAPAVLARAHEGSGFDALPPGRSTAVDMDIEAALLGEAEMVFATLSSTRRKSFLAAAAGAPFETVLIDEAGQASESATLQPLALGARRCVLVGDPQQLPATILSEAAKAALLDRSLFERLASGGVKPSVLQVQYRMHPSIRRFPSRFFYHDALLDAPSVVALPDEIFYLHPLFKPYVVFDVARGVERRGGGGGGGGGGDGGADATAGPAAIDPAVAAPDADTHRPLLPALSPDARQPLAITGSVSNAAEAAMAAGLFGELRAFLSRAARSRPGSVPGPVRVGVLTPYREQVAEIKRAMLRELGAQAASEVQVATIDSFQGKQLDVAIFSCVRAGAPGGIGFLSDVRRMNVGITRGRRALWVLGAEARLRGCPEWRALFDDARERGLVVEDADAGELFPWLPSVRGRGAGGRPTLGDTDGLGAAVLENHMPTFDEYFAEDDRRCREEETEAEKKKRAEEAARGKAEEDDARKNAEHAETTHEQPSAKLQPTNATGGSVSLEPLGTDVPGRMNGSPERAAPVRPAVALPSDPRAKMRAQRAAAVARSGATQVAGSAEAPPQSTPPTDTDNGNRTLPASAPVLTGAPAEEQWVGPRPAGGTHPRLPSDPRARAATRKAAPPNDAGGAATTGVFVTPAATGNATPGNPVKAAGAPAPTLELGAPRPPKAALAANSAPAGIPLDPRKARGKRIEEAKLARVASPRASMRPPEAPPSVPPRPAPSLDEVPSFVTPGPGANQAAQAPPLSNRTHSSSSSLVTGRVESSVPTFSTGASAEPASPPAPGVGRVMRPLVAGPLGAVEGVLWRPLEGTEEPNKPRPREVEREGLQQHAPGGPHWEHVQGQDAHRWKRPQEAPGGAGQWQAGEQQEQGTRRQAEQDQGAPAPWPASGEQSWETRHGNLPQQREEPPPAWHHHSGLPSQPRPQQQQDERQQCPHHPPHQEQLECSRTPPASQQDVWAAEPSAQPQWQQQQQQQQHLQQPQQQQPWQPQQQHLQQPQQQQPWEPQQQHLQQPQQQQPWEPQQQHLQQPQQQQPWQPQQQHLQQPQQQQPWEPQRRPSQQQYQQQQQQQHQPQQSWQQHQQWEYRAPAPERRQQWQQPQQSPQLHAETLTQHVQAPEWTQHQPSNEQQQWSGQGRGSHSSQSLQQPQQQQPVFGSHPHRSTETPTPWQGARPTPSWQTPPEARWPQATNSHESSRSQESSGRRFPAVTSRPSPPSRMAEGDRPVPTRSGPWANGAPPQEMRPSRPPVPDPTKRKSFNKYPTLPGKR